MAQFTVNATRFDPYKNFKFRVKWDGQYVAGICKVSALKRTTEVVEHRRVENARPRRYARPGGRREVRRRRGAVDVDLREPVRPLRVERIDHLDRSRATGDGDIEIETIARRELEPLERQRRRGVETIDRDDLRVEPR